MDEFLETRLRKLLILSERGIDGEKENASQMLNKLLDKHNLSIEDISDDVKNICWFKYKGKLQEKLLRQIIASTAGRDVEMWINKGKRNILGASITKCHMLEIEMLFNAYKVALEEEFEFALEAFINKNDIFSPSDENKADKKYTDEEIERAKLLSARMMSMKKVKVYKQLPDTQG